MPLLFHFANIFGSPKHFDAAASRLVSDSQLAAHQAYPQVAESSAGNPQFNVDGSHRGMPVAAHSSMEAVVAV
jgi:hypothetical protein